MIEAWLQITAGQGPVECAWAVMRVLDKLSQEAKALGIEVRMLEVEPGLETGTANSALVSVVGGADIDSFVLSWRGAVQWIAPSPFRPEHKRKNWFVGVEVIEPVEEFVFDARDVRWETMRASGPGGQHVNRTESAVRVTHVPTGLCAVSSEERSQYRNRKLALARLAQRIADRGADAHGASRAKRWRAHHEVERGNPVRVFQEGAELRASLPDGSRRGSGDPQS